jgi:hypothetical protein
MKVPIREDLANHSGLESFPHMCPRNIELLLRIGDDPNHSSSSAFGIEKEKIDPPSGAASTQILPPYCSMIR